MELAQKPSLPRPFDRTRRPRRLRVVVLGLRGIVGVEGGIETHARMLYPLLTRLGCDVEVIQRSPYYDRATRPSTWHGVRLTYLWSPKGRSIETAVHSVLSVLYAALARPDVLHIHAVGPGFLAPLARLLGLNVVLTYHARDYEREKFSGWEKWLLRAGEQLGVRFSNHPIAVSRALQTELKSRFGKEVSWIPNGAPRPVRAASRTALNRFGLVPRRYVLCVGRLDPVKRHFDLIDAFERARTRGWKLVIVGGLDQRDEYCRRVCRRTASSPDIVLTDYQRGRALRELYSHAGLFVLASSSEGHPIALLEALSYGVPSIASAIPANLAVPLQRDRYFIPGDVKQLTEKLDTSILDRDDDGPEVHVDSARIREQFSWRRAAGLTYGVYERVVAHANGN